MKFTAFAIFCALGIAPATAQTFHYENPPLFDNCGDLSLSKARTEGITLGISPSPPYSSINPSNNKAEGLDVEINEAALHWAGIDKIRYEVMPFGQLIPAMLSGRIDSIAANIHVTPDRLKAISFTSPAWWYGPAIVVQKGNPKGFDSFESLKGKSVGVIAGSAADEYLRASGAQVTVFQTDAEEFGGIGSGRVDALVEDDVKALDFMKANPSAGLELVQHVAVPDALISGAGYGYARYAVRKADCSLRAAYSQGLSEVRGSGEVSAILKKYGLSNRNLVLFPL